MNAETRAKEVIDKLCFCGSELRRLIGHEGIVYIAAAITRAQNDKLEEAAAHFERYSAALSGRSFAATLRALKSEDTP